MVGSFDSEKQCRSRNDSFFQTDQNLVHYADSEKGRHQARITYCLCI
ncbi:MAG: hypothetical protein IJ620_01490 [Bacteroidales bacterium]|nr:hypothetical protein [Bacteroidales bacterium]